MTSLDPTLVVPSCPAGPELLLSFLLVGLGLVIGYPLGHTDWSRWRDRVVGDREP